MIDYSDNVLVIFKYRGSLLPKAFVCSLPCVIVAFCLSWTEVPPKPICQILACGCSPYSNSNCSSASALTTSVCRKSESSCENCNGVWCEDRSSSFRKDTGIDDLEEPLLWNAMSVVILFLLSIRSFQALGRFWEGTSLLHKMRGEWFDVATLLTTFSRDAKLNWGKEALVSEFRHTLIRLMSLMHGCALDEISDTDSRPYEVLDIWGLDDGTLRFLKDCKEEHGFNRVEALQHMIQVLITHNHHNGVLTIAPPILGRVYQSLSRGLVNLLNAKKIKDTMFPFPYAQLILLLLLVHSLFVPALVNTVVENKVCAVAISFVIALGLFSINFIASELEMPFGSESNSLPLLHFQTEFNDSLLMLIHDSGDVLTHTSLNAIKVYEKLQGFARDSVLVATAKLAKKVLIDSHSKSFANPGFLEAHKKLEREAQSLMDIVSMDSAATHPDIKTESVGERPQAAQLQPPQVPQGLQLPPPQVASPPPPAPAPAPEAPAVTAAPQAISPTMLSGDGLEAIPDEIEVAPGSHRAVSAESMWEQQDTQRKLEAQLNIEQMRHFTETLGSLSSSFPSVLSANNSAMQEATACVLRCLRTPSGATLD